MKGYKALMIQEALHYELKCLAAQNRMSMNELIKAMKNFYKTKPTPPERNPFEVIGR